MSEKLLFDIFDKNTTELIAACKTMQECASFRKIFKQAHSELLECYKNGNKVYIAGNGGSAADAQHLAAEFVSKLSVDRNPLPAEALTTNTSILTAIGNDYGYEKIFSRQLAASMKKGDMFLGITTSGNSVNVVEAFRIAADMGNKSILLSGMSGGVAKKMASYAILVPSERTSTIQELHIQLAHTLCESIEREIFKDKFK